MKLCLIIPSFYPAVVYGGPIFSTLHACEELAKLNVDIRVSTTNTNRDSKLLVKTGCYIEMQKSFYVKYYNETIIGKLSLPLIFNVWKDIKQADVIHIQAIFSTPTPISLLYAKIFKKPVVLSPRGAMRKWSLKQHESRKNKWLQWLIRPFADSIVWHATSEIEKEEILAIYPYAKVIIIPNGVDLDEMSYHNKLSKEQFVDKYAPLLTNQTCKTIIISAGRLQAVKGFDILIHAFAMFLKQKPDSFLFIAGEDETELDNLQRLVDELNIKQNVTFTGLLSGQDKIDFYTNADLFVLPSHSENFGNVYLEALAAGTPIIASKNTPWQIVEEYNCGRWVDNTINDIYQAMIEVVDEDFAILSENAKRCAGLFQWDYIGQQFKDIYKKLQSNVLIGKAI